MRSATTDSQASEVYIVNQWKMNNLNKRSRLWLCASHAHFTKSTFFQIWAFPGDVLIDDASRRAIRF